MTADGHDYAGTFMLLICMIGLVLTAVHTAWWLPFSGFFFVLGLCNYSVATDKRAGKR